MFRGHSVAVSCCIHWRKTLMWIVTVWEFYHGDWRRAGWWFIWPERVTGWKGPGQPHFLWKNWSLWTVTSTSYNTARPTTLLLLGDPFSSEAANVCTGSSCLLLRDLHWTFSSSWFCAGRRRSMLQKMAFCYLVARTLIFNLFNSRKKSNMYFQVLLSVFYPESFTPCLDIIDSFVKCSSISTEKNHGGCVFVLEE